MAPAGRQGRTWRASQLGVLPRSLVGRKVERDRQPKRAQAAGVCVYAISSAGAPMQPPPAFAELDMVAIGRKGGTGPFERSSRKQMPTLEPGVPVAVSVDALRIFPGLLAAGAGPSTHKYHVG
jgi:hypothetical protein